MDKQEITQEFLKEHFEYRDGHLFWVKPTAGNVKVGQPFGCYSNGYRIGGLRGKMYKEHRLIWLYHHGTWPIGDIDHINGIPGDNRIENLREATRQQNQFNRKSDRGSTSRYKGVCWEKQRNKWRAQYGHNGKYHYLGLYETEEEAAEAYQKATDHLHKDFANYGQSQG